MATVDTLKRTQAPIMDAEIIDIPTDSQKERHEDVSKALQIINKDGEVNLTALTDEQRTKYSQLTKNLVLNDVNSIANYGVELQNSMSKYSHDFLSSVRSSQSGEVSTLITSLLSELDGVDLGDFQEQSSFKKFMRKLPILRNLVTSVEKINRKYDTIEKNVDDISRKIATTSLIAQRDNNALQVMFDNNVQYIKNIEDLIIAGKLKAEEVGKKLEYMMSHTDEFQPYEIQDVQKFANNLDKRVHDMITLRYVMVQSLSQIRVVQANNIAIANKAQTIQSTTIPAWRNQLSIAVALNNQNKNIEAHRKISDATNEILLRNAELLRENSVATAKETERSVVDIETLKQTTEKLVQTILDVKQVHEKGIADRRAAEQDILKLGHELEQSMTKIIGSTPQNLLT